MEMKENKQLILEMLLNEPDKYALYSKIIKNYTELIAGYIEQGFNFPEIASFIEKELGQNCNIKSKSLYMAWMRYKTKEPKEKMVSNNTIDKGGNRDCEKPGSDNLYKKIDDINLDINPIKKNIFENLDNK
jgi:hypothetical protein